MSSLSRKLRVGLRSLRPRGVVANIAVYLGALDLLLLLIEAAGKILKKPGMAGGLDGWISGFTFLVACAAFLLLVRFARKHMLWRLRNRLIVTYVFIGVIPLVLLVLLVLLGGYFLVGQFATYLAISDLRAEVAQLATANEQLSSELAAQLRAGVAPERAAEVLRASQQLNSQAGRDVSFWFRGQAVRVENGSPGDDVATLPPWLSHVANATPKASFADVVTGPGRPRLMAVRGQKVNGQALVVATWAPMNHALASRLAQNLGQISILGADGGENQAQPDDHKSLNFQYSDEHSGPVNVQINGKDASKAPLARGGEPIASSWSDPAFSFIGFLSIYDWNTGGDATLALGVRTTVTMVYRRLSHALGEFSTIVFDLMVAVAIIFGIIEVLALFIGVRLTRTVTGAVAELYQATRHINRGDFSHRIRVRANDQLAALETSFNSMTESLEELLAEQKEKQRMQNELAIAQEVQEQLFPRHIVQLKSLEVFGVCRPARTVSGDYYDFLPMGDERMAIALGDISGKGISAALLMATLHSAVRSFLVLHERELASEPAMAAAMAARQSAVAPAKLEALSLQPAQWLGLLNTHLYHSTPESKYATLFLGEYDGRAQTLTYCNGGHLSPLVIGGDGGVRRLEAGGMVVGLFDGMAYNQEAVKLAPGDLLVAYSDGITEPENEFGEFGEERLLELVRAHRSLPLARIADEVMAAVLDWIGGAEQPDDMTLMLARAQ